jgi:hypothetical protein
MIGNGTLAGTVDNEPMLDIGVQYKSTVTFNITAIEALLPAVKQRKQ